MSLNMLRSLMQDNNLDAYLVLTSDPHNSEYLAQYYKERQHLTKFTGSQGTAVVTKDKAYLWADGRYFEQAECQIAGTGFKLMKIGVDGVPTVNEFLKSINCKRIGYNALYMPISEYETMEKEVPNSELVDIDLYKKIWTDRSFNKTKSFSHSEWSDRDSKEKLNIVRDSLKAKDATATLVTSLEGVAWLSNTRGNDIENVPVTFAYVLVTLEGAKLFIDNSKIESFKDELEENLEIYEYDEIFEVLSELESEKFILSPQTNTKLYKLIEEKNEVLGKDDIVGYLKSVKSAGELDHIRESHIRDGLYVTKFMYWLKNSDLSNETEWTCANKIDSLRASDSRYLDLSFGTISAYGPNASMMHYSADEKSAAKIENRGFLLVDSGGQYLDGTTDITRTFAVGELTEEEKEHFTYVLKSHLQLMRAVFPEKTKSLCLDAIARKEVWAINEDYRCGTGHGVGYVLGVHESPPQFNTRSDKTLAPGMIISNEPGIYKDGKHGIRIENILEVVEDKYNDYGQFLKFETISYAPIDLDAVKVELLTKEEKECLNKYHKAVYEKLNGLMSEEERTWLKEYTREI
ncbi:aminopeptidase P family protein [Peptoniphilus asaccharolyticus]